MNMTTAQIEAKEGANRDLVTEALGIAVDFMRMNIADGKAGLTYMHYPWGYATVTWDGSARVYGKPCAQCKKVSTDRIPGRMACAAHELVGHIVRETTVIFR